MTRSILNQGSFSLTKHAIYRLNQRIGVSPMEAHRMLKTAKPASREELHAISPVHAFRDQSREVYWVHRDYRGKSFFLTQVEGVAKYRVITAFFVPSKS